MISSELLSYVSVTLFSNTIELGLREDGNVVGDDWWMISYLGLKASARDGGIEVGTAEVNDVIMAFDLIIFKAAFLSNVIHTELFSLNLFVHLDTSNIEDIRKLIITTAPQPTIL